MTFETKYGNVLIKDALTLTKNLDSVLIYDMEYPLYNLLTFKQPKYPIDHFLANYFSYMYSLNRDYTLPTEISCLDTASIVYFIGTDNDEYILDYLYDMKKIGVSHLNKILEDDENSNYIESTITYPIDCWAAADVINLRLVDVKTCIKKIICD